MTSVAEQLEEHRGVLWGIAYRLTGTAADADDVVQDTFVQALARPPARLDEPLRPWLVRVAVNRGRDLLRRRRRRRYEGVWLPSPMAGDCGGVAPEPASSEDDWPQARYERLESVTFAFLLALEALTPTQRAVLLLRDVFDLSVRETAQTLDLSEANVKTTHSRARRAIAAYDEARVRPSDPLQRATREALEGFLATLQAQDVDRARELLASSVVALADGGGEYHAARQPITGPDAVARLYVGLAGGRASTPVSLRWTVLNGLPAIVLEMDPKAPGWAPRAVIQCQLDAHGRIERLYSVMASRKLSGIGTLPA